MSSEHRHVNPWIVAVAVMFATFMEVLDTTVVNVSLPHIAGNLSATIDGRSIGVPAWIDHASRMNCACVHASGVADRVPSPLFSNTCSGSISPSLAVRAMVCR